MTATSFEDGDLATHWRQQMIAGGALEPQSARVFVFDWLLGLPAGLDPALAAQAILAGETSAIARPLRELLAAIADFPAARLDRLMAGGRRLTWPYC